VVVGGGIAGVATAYHLRRGGAKVVLLEARTIAEAASGRNAGFLLAGVAENFIAASRRYGEANTLRIWRFTRRNQALVRDLVQRHAIACDLAWKGSDQIAGDDEEWREIQASAERLRGEGVAVRLSPEACVATYVDDGELHPARYVRGLARAFAAAGGAIYERSPATAVSGREARTTDATARAGAVVVCTNAYAAHLVPLRIRPVRGQMLATAPLPHRVFERPAYAHRGFRYWRQRDDGRILVGGWRDTAIDEEIGEDERATEVIQGQLDRFVHERAPDAAITHRWAGTMGFSHDGLPYVGATADGIFVNAGFTGHGMAFATATGALVADLIGGHRPDDTDLFAPERS
jgi:glycine/D-amino acid oxidase-like deaminating enzyme